MRDTSSKTNEVRERERKQSDRTEEKDKSGSSQRDEMRWFRL